MDWSILVLHYNVQSFWSLCDFPAAARAISQQFLVLISGLRLQKEICITSITCDN